MKSERRREDMQVGNNRALQAKSKKLNRLVGKAKKSKLPCRLVDVNPDYN